MTIRYYLSALVAIFFAVQAGSCVAYGSQHAVTKPGSINTCVRHDPIGFFTTPEILGELGQVYANCDPQPVCSGPFVDQETKQIDGYIDPSKWTWMGLSTDTFNVAQQGAVIANAIALANAAAPSGKVIVNITFFRDIIVGNGPDTYVMYIKVIYARCSTSTLKNGMTWVHKISNAVTGTITVGCDSTAPDHCDSYHGDTMCTQLRPVLCIYKPSTPFPVPIGVNNSDQYNKWSGGVVATTAPVQGPTSQSAGDNLCQSNFGSGWRWAEFHDGWGWNFQAYGGTVSAPNVPSDRFWVYINDQPANCW